MGGIINPAISTMTLGTVDPGRSDVFGPGVFGSDKDRQAFAGDVVSFGTVSLSGTSADAARTQQQELAKSQTQALSIGTPIVPAAATGQSAGELYLSRKRAEAARTSLLDGMTPSKQLTDTGTLG